MAASEETCDGNPNFAIICSFITKFGDDCGVNTSIPYLQQMLEDTKNVNEDLQELLIHLLRRGRKRVNKERWEKCLIKFCHEYSSVDAWEIERFGFTKAKLSVKLEILKRLLELQFDANAKFKAEVNKLDASSLRLLPLGRDIEGQAYWYQLDKEYNLRLYRETIGEEGAWQLLCSNTEDIRKLLTNLEKKHSGSTEDTCEDKSNDSNNPKSPDMLPVPKKELDTEDLTSHLSESKPCTIIIKTEKRDGVSHAEVTSCVKNDNCAIETDKKTIGCELENSTKGSVKLKLKLEPSRTDQKSSDRTVVECTTVIEKASVLVVDPEPMEVETSKTVSSDADQLPQSIAANDVEMVEEVNASKDKSKSESMSEEQTDQNFSTNNSNSTVAIEHSDSINHHKSSKIRLYEKWNSEKKKIDSAQSSAEECSIDSKTSSVVEENDQCYSVTSNQKNDPAIPLKYPSEQSSTSELIIIKQSNLSEQSMTTDVETAVDLSKSSRVNVIVQNMCSKPVLSNGVSSTIKSNTEKSENDSVRNFNSSSIQTDKKSDSSIISTENSLESSLEVKYKSYEAESNKVHKRKQSYPECYDASVITKTSSGLGFSHLQALQNMCESNAMGGIPSVIQSTNRRITEPNRTVISENKNIVNSDVRYENVSRKYNFNDVHCSNKTHSSDSETTNILLKSNVHKSDDERNEKMEFKPVDYQTKIKSSNFNAPADEKESSQEAPTDLSCSATTAKTDCDPKPSEASDKTSASTVSKEDTILIKGNIGVDVEEAERVESPEVCDLSKKGSMCTAKSPVKKCDIFEEKSTNLCNSSRGKSILDTSAKDKESLDGEHCTKELCQEKTGANSSESAIKSNKSGYCSTDVPSEISDSCKKRKDHKDSSHVGKDVCKSETVKEPDKDVASDNTISEPISNSSISCASSIKSKEELFTSAKESVLKKSKDKSSTELKESAESKCKFENKTSSQLKETECSIKPCLEKSEHSEKKGNTVSVVKPSSSDREIKALVDTKSCITHKKQKVIPDELLSKSSKSFSSEEERSENELIIELQSESSNVGENISCNETVGDEKNNKTKSDNEVELNLKVDKIKLKDFVSNGNNLSNTADKSETSELISTNNEKCKNKKDFEKVHDKGNDFERVSENEMDIEKASENKKNVEKIFENKNSVGKISENKMDIEEVSENKIDIEKISENRMNAEDEKRKDVKKVSENDMDMEDIIENKKDIEKVSENRKSTEKIPKNEISVEKESESKNDVEKVSEREKDLVKVSKSKKEAEKVSEEVKDTTNISKTKKDIEKISEKEKDIVKVPVSKKDEKEKNVVKVPVSKKDEKEKDIVKISPDKKDVEKEKDIVKISPNKKDVKKVSEKENDIVKLSPNKKDVEKVSEKVKDIVKVSTNKKDVEKISEKEKDIVKKSQSKKDVEEASEDNKDVTVSKTNKGVEKVSKNENGIEKVSEDENNVETAFENKKDIEKVSVNEKDVENISENKKDAEKVHKKEKVVQKVSKKDKSLEKALENKKDNVKRSENVQVVEKESKREKDLEKVGNQRDTVEVPDKRESDTKLSEKEKDSEKASEKKRSSKVLKNKRRVSLKQEEKSPGTTEEVKKLDSKKYSSEKKDVDSKSEISDLSASLRENEEKSLESKKDSDKSKVPCSPENDSALKCESLTENNKEKLKLCSKIVTEERLESVIEEKDEEKSSGTVSGKNICESQSIDGSTESKNKTDEKSECSANEKDVEMPDISGSTKGTDELSDVTKLEDACKNSDAQIDDLNDRKVKKVSRSRKSKGRPRRKISMSRRKTRNTKDSSLDMPDLKTDCEIISSAKEDKGESEEISVPPSTNQELNSSSTKGKTTVSHSKQADECNKSVLSSKASYEEQFKVYNLRHSTCLEAKFKHPFCDKYVRTGEVKKMQVLADCTIELIDEQHLLENINEISPPRTKTRSRGRISNQPVSKNPQPVAIPVTKPAPPAKKTPAANAKKRPSRNRKKEDTEKDDFAIPEGFLEILGNADKVVSEKGTSGKKRKGFESKDTSASQQNSEGDTPIKRSRRIQEQHQKKMTELAVEMEREQRILEQLAKRSNNAKKNARSSPQKPPPKPAAKTPAARNNAKGSSTPTKSPKARAKIQALTAEEETCMESRRTTRKMNSRSKNLTKMTLMYEDESKDSQFSTSRETEKSKRRKRGRGQRKGFRPWDVSSESESSIEELTEEEEEEPEEILIFDVNEDEFACEEVDPNAEPVIVRRARTAKKSKPAEIEDAVEEIINDDTPCKKCGKYDKPEWILLCDKCDSGYHTHCLIPPLMIVPDGDWFCQPCEHMSLCQCLHEELSRLEVVLKQREREELRKQRLAYVGISLDNVLKPEKKEKSDESEKEEPEKNIEERKTQRAVKQAAEEERQQKLYGKRSVRARRNVNYQFKEYDELIASALQEEMLEVPEDEFKEEENGSEAGSDKPFTAKISKRRRRGRRWKDLDFSDEDEDSADDYQGGSTDSEATQPPSSNTDQESGSGEWKITNSRKKSHRRPTKSRRRRRRGGDSSEEDWEDEVAGNEAYRPTTRRAAQKAISYRELSSEEEEEWDAKPQVVKKRRKASSSESESSFKRKPSKKKRIRKWASSDSSESEEEKSMSSSEGESEEEGSQEGNSESEWKIDQKEKIMRLKSNTNKKVLSSDEDEESSTRDSAPKKQPKKIISDESEEEDEDEEEEEEEEESESEENSEESEEEEEEEDVKEKKSCVPEKKIPCTKNIDINSSKPDGEKKTIPSEKTESASEKVSSTDKEESLAITENREFQPKVLVKKELCSVDIPLEPMKQTVTVTPVVDKAPPKTVRKETTKMVPCVIPYDKSPKSGHTSNPEEESDKEISKEEEMPHAPLHRPAHIPKKGATFPSPPSRIQFGGVLARHSIPPLNSSVRPTVPPSSVPPSSVPSRMLAPTNLSTRPSTAPGVVVRHTASPSNLSVRPNIPSSNVLVPPSTPSTTAPSTQTVQTKSENKPYKSTIMEPFSNMDDENDSDDEVPLERIPTACVPAPLPNRPVSYEREAEYRPAAKELSSYSYAPPEEKPFPGSYSSLAPFQDYSTRPSPLKPSLVETYPNNSSPSKLTPLDTYSQTSSPKGFISLDSYSENRKKKHFYGNTPAEAESSHRPAAPPSSSENYQGGEIRFPPEPYPCPQSPNNTYPNRSPSPTQRDPGTPPRLYSQFPDAYAPPRSPEYYQNHQYYASEERIPRPSYQPNYAPQEPSFVSNPYVATPVPQPNGGFMIDTLLRARNHENEEDELTGVTDIVSYITQE